MEVYILNGVEITLEDLQGLVEKSGYSLEDFKAINGVTVKKKDVADQGATVTSKDTEASWESRLENTRSDWEKYRKSQLLNKEGKYDPNLQTDPNHRMPDGSQNYINKRNEFTIKERELNDKIEGYYLDPKNMDFNKPKTILNQGEDTVKEYIREKFPFYNVEDGTAGNLLKIQTAEGFKEIDLNPLFSDNKKEAIETIKYLEQAAKDIEDDVVVGLVMNKLADNIKDTGDVSSVNTYLKDNTPYQIEKTIVPGKTSTGLQGVSTPDTTMYNIVKDGEIISSLPIDKVDDFLRDNITQEEFNSMNTTSVKALETVTGMRRAYIEQQQDIVEVKPATKIKYYKDDFGTDVLKVLDRLNFTDEEKQTVEKYIANTQSQKGEMQLATAPGMARRQGASPYQIIQELTALDGLPDDLKEKLINAGFIDEMKTVVDAGIKNTAFKEVNKGIPTMLEDMLTQFDKGELLDLANYFNENIAGAEKDEEGNIIKGEFVKKINVDNLDLDGSIKDQIKIGGDISDTNKFIIKRSYQKKEKEAIKAYEDFYPAKMDSLTKEVISLGEQLPEDAYIYTANTPSGPLLRIKIDRKVSASENETIKNISGKLAGIQSTYHNLEFDRKNSADKIINNRNAFYDQLQDAEKNDDIIATANKEFGLGNLLVKDINDAFSSLALTVPTLFNSEWAIGKQKQLNDKNDYYKTMTEPEFSAEYILRTLGQQSANITLAVATAGAGSALGLTTATVANTIGIGFGAVSGTQTFRDLNIEVDTYEEAERQEKIYKAAYKRGEISEYNYTMAMRDINTTLAMDKLTPDQIMNASLSNAIIEGTLTRYLGTAANSIALVKNFNSVNVGEIAKQLNKSGFTKGINLIGRPLVGRTGLETVEELGIFAGQNFITDTAILGRGADRETFLKGANETFWATVVTAGMSQSTGITYGGMNSYGITKKYEKILNGSNFFLNDLSSSIQSLSDSKSDQEVKKLLLFQYQEELKAMGLTIDENSIDLLNISNENTDGSSDLKNLIGTQLIKQDYLRSLGIQPGTNAQQDSAIEALKDNSSEQQKKDIETTLSSLDTQINNIKEKASKASNYDVAKKALGSIYTFYDNQLKGDTEYDAASTKNKLVKIINNVREDTRLQNIKNAKSNPFVVKQVESMYAGPGFASNKTKDTTYENLGANMALNQGRAYSTSLNVNIQASTIFGKDLKSVNVVGYENDEQIGKELEKAGLTPEEIVTAIDKIKNNKAFGLVFGKTIFTQSPDLANENLDNGEIQAGTVILHELTHITKDADMKSPESKKKYFDNLFLAASTSSNQALVSIHQQTVGLLGNKTEENKAKWEDEYSNILQEQLYYYEKEVQLEKDDSFITKIFGRANPANLNTPEKALDYLAASNSAFRKGKISNATQKSVESFEGSNLKGSVKNINKLVIGKTYDQLKNDPEFRRQYDNVAVKAMKFDQELGNEINRKTVLGEAYIQLPSIIKNYKPVNEKGESQTFTNYVYQTLDPQKRTAAFYRKELGEIPTQKIGKMQLIGDEDADANIKREAREKLEGKGKSLIKTNELRGVKNKLTEVDEAIGDIDRIEFANLLDSRSGELDFAKINEEYGSEVAGALYGLNPKDAINLAKKFKKGADLTYGQNKREKGSKLISEAERIQSDYTSIQDAKEMISLFPEYNISTPTAVTSKTGQETKTSELVQGRSLGTAPAVLDFFYEPYTDPKSLNKKTKKDAITNPSGRSKGKTSQVNVVRLKPEFNYKAGSITNAAVVRAQRKIGITKSGKLNVPPKGKARTDFGRLLIGLANLKGAIVANTAVDTKVKKGIKDGTIKTAKSALQIEADLKAGRSRIQYSEKLKQGKQTIDAVYDFARNKEAAKLFGPVFLTFFNANVNADAGFRGVIYNPISGIEESSKGAFNTGRSFISSLKKLRFKYGKSNPEIVAATESLIAEGKLGVLEDVLKIAQKTLNEVAVDAKPSDKDVENNNAMRMAMAPQDYTKYKNSNKKNLKTLKKGKKLILSKFKELYDSNNKLLPLIQYVTYAVNSNSHPFRNLAILEGGVEYGYEEHMLQYKPFVDTFIAAIKSTKTDFDGFIEWANDTYFQESITKQNLKGEANGMAQSVLDQASRNINRFTNEIITPWRSQFEMHPLMKKQVKEALEGKRKWEDVISVDIRKYNEYNYKSDYGLINPNVQSRFGITDAQKYNVVVPSQFKFDPTIIAVQNKAIYEYLLGNISKAEAMVKVQLEVNKTFKPNATVVIAKNNKADKAMADARNSIKYNEKRKGISVFDFDDTLAQSNSNVLYTMPDGTTGSLTAGEFAVKALDLTNLGAKFDFSEFNEVKEGRKGPLADVALKRQGKFGSKDIFVLTARPQAADINIKKFLEEIGLNIPLENITGLENGTAEAKAEWMIGKYADGYNDFYFADDAFKNVEAVRNVFDVLDVKSDVQQARLKFSEKLDKDFNDMIERNMGVKSEYTYSDILARRKGRNQKRFAFFIPPSADDFRGLTMYTFAGKGKQGELDQEFFDKALIKPYMSGINAMELAKNKIKNAYKILEKTSPKVRKKLKKKIGDTKYTNDEAIRIYLWNKDGAIIPGLSKTDQNQVVKLVEADVDLMAFAEGVKLITEKDTYVPPNEYWDGTTIIGDLSRLSKEINRDEYLKEFKDNADILFTDKNMNKIEAVYGFRVREALENSLYRMKTGSNKAAGSGRIVTAWNNWVNNSVGAIMFFNRRSALLQMLSAGNFVNWSDNNPLKAGLAFANAPQYWKDVVYLFNSPKLKARRQGLEGDIQEKEIAEASRRGGMEGALSYLLKIGFTPTQIADSIAISTGGASFYRNRINTYKKEGYTVEDAEKKAFDDFSAISDETQQSADPMLISSQQAGVLGRLVLSFQNTPMQYTRLMKKAGQDLINNRGDAKTNISKILYYGFIQNLIFSTLQNAMFALVPGFEDDEEEPDFKTDKERDAWLKKQGGKESAKITRVANNMLDTILRGSGLAGAVVSTIKNVIIEYTDRQDMGILAKSRANADLLIALTSISPPISSKIRKVNKALDLEDFEKDVIAERGYSVTIDGKFQLSPSYNVIGNVASATLNLPLDRVFDEVNSITEALDDRNSAYQRLALGLGWKTWDVNAKIEEHDLIKTNAKAKRKIEGKEKSKQTRENNKEILKTHKRLRSQVLNALPGVMRDSIRRKEKEDNKITAIYKLNQLKAKYIE